MDATLIVGDLYGKVLAELDVDISPTSWRLNDIGKTGFAIPVSNPKANRDVLHVGNRVIIQFSNGLPPWGGTIELPRVWADNQIYCQALSAENILEYKITNDRAIFSGIGVGEVLKRLLPDSANIIIGEVVDGVIGPHEYHLETLLSVIEGFGVDFDITPSLVDGRIMFTINLYDPKGSSKPNTALIEGHNIQSASLSEQGPIINNWFVAGQGTNWDVRAVGGAIDIISSGQYGKRQASKVLVDIVDQATLDARALEAVQETSNSHNILDLSVVDSPPAYFRDYDIGDIVKIQLFSYGFGGFHTSVRVLSREINLVSGTMRLVVQETT